MSTKARDGYHVQMLESVQLASSPAGSLARLLEARRVGLVRTRSAETALALGRALLDAGLEAIEVSFVTPDAAHVIAALVAEGRGIVGAGTVIDAERARAASSAGAAFLVSPGQPAGMVERAHEAGATAILGGLTPTEILSALAMGADVVKVFPIRAVGGPSYLRDVLAPMPDTRFLVSGGVTLANHREYLAAGASLCTLGSGLVPENLLIAGDWPAVTAHVRAALAAS